jgi:hypothetical protein
MVIISEFGTIERLLDNLNRIPNLKLRAEASGAGGGPRAGAPVTAIGYHGFRGASDFPQSDGECDQYRTPPETAHRVERVGSES